MDEADIPMIISVDDHVVEPPHVWSTWLPARYRDRGPRIERRGIRAIEFAGAAAYLLGDDARNVTGTTLYVDSGYHAMGM